MMNQYKFSRLIDRLPNQLRGVPTVYRTVHGDVDLKRTVGDGSDSEEMTDRWVTRTRQCGLLDYR